VACPDPGCQPILAVSDPSSRPFWSVMIPTYNAGAWLEIALRSVLNQDPGPDRMQVAVVDDASPNGNAKATVERVGNGRVEFHGHDQNVGLAANWNRCLALSRGRWVHVLHQDDFVLPGFYDLLGRADQESSEVGSAFCQNAFVDELSNWHGLSKLERRTAGLLESWLGQISHRQAVQCAAVVVKREVYEKIGGFRNDLCFVLDWEMWVRIAANFPVWYEPSVLACFRSHESSETSRLKSLGRTLADTHAGVRIVRGYLPAEHRAHAGVDLISEERGCVMKAANRLLDQGDRVAAIELVREVCRHEPLRRFSRSVLRARSRAAILSVGEAIHLRRGGSIETK
jgi:Glycosyl transferase family 2